MDTGSIKFTDSNINKADKKVSENKARVFKNSKSNHITKAILKARKEAVDDTDLDKSSAEGNKTKFKINSKIRAQAKLRSKSKLVLKPRPKSEIESKLLDAESVDLKLWLLNQLNHLIESYKSQLLFVFDCIKIVIFLFLFLFIHNRANAQTLEEQRLLSKSPWNFLNDITFDTNAQPLDAVDNSSGATYTTGFRYSLGKKRNLWAFGRGAKRFTGEERLDLLDTIVRVEQVLDKKFFGMATRARVDAILPTNEFIREQTTFVGALGGQFRFTKPLPYKLFLIWNNNLRWNFHNERVSELAIPNIQTTASTLVNLSYVVNPKIQTAVGLGWSVARSYGNTLTDFYSIDLNVSYVLTSELNILAGWTTAGSPFSADGQNTNIKLFDERDTTFYFSFTHFM